MQVQKRSEMLRKFICLANFEQVLNTIVKVFEAYQLPGLFNDAGSWVQERERDPILKHLTEIVQLFSNRRTLTVNVFASTYAELEAIFVNLEDERWKVFDALLNAPETVKFLRERKLISREEKGNSDFDTVRQQVTANIGNMKHETLVLNHFILAQTYCSTVLGHCSFNAIINAIRRLQSFKFECLKTTEQNLSMIRLWVTEASGNTLKNNINRARLLLSEGVWQTQLPSMQYNIRAGHNIFTPDDINDIQVYFAFDLSGEEGPTELSANSATGGDDQELKVTVQRFQTALKLFMQLHEAIIELHSNGHPRFGFETQTVDFPFSTPTLTLATLLESYQQRVYRWNSETATMYVPDHLSLFLFSFVHFNLFISFVTGTGNGPICSIIPLLSAFR